MKRLDHVPLNVETLQAAYAYLSTTPPFSKWNMPDSEDVVFVVERNSSVYGQYWNMGTRKKPLHHISASIKKISHTITLIELMAHEMLHLHQDRTRQATAGVEHNAAFLRDAEKICAVHGFDPRSFI